MGSGKRMNHPVTLADVAREAGCSAGAVSFVILNSHAVSGELRQKILAAIEKLGYHPYAKQTTRIKKMIALISMISPGGTMEGIGFLQELLERRGYLMQTYFLPLELKDMKTYLTAINRDKLLAGIICLHPRIESFDLLRYCKDLPSVIYSRSGSMLSHVTLKYHVSGLLAARHFFERGHRKAAIILYGDVLTRPVMHQVAEEFQKAIPETEGFATEIITIPREEATEQGLAPKLEKLRADGVTAWFVGNAFIANAVQQWAYRAKLTYPKDFSLIMLDFDGMAPQILPPVTSIAFPTEKMMELTVDSLLAKLANTPQPEEEFLPYLIDRDSVKRIRRKTRGER